MTLKEIFKKVETYNEIAYMMRTHKAKIFFYTKDLGSIVSFGESFESLESLRKYIKTNYIKEFANEILKGSSYDLDKEIEIEYADYFGTHNVIVGVELVAA